MAKEQFKLLTSCTDLVSAIVMETAQSPKNYRNGICRDVRELSYQVLFSINDANGCSVGSQERQDYQEYALDFLQKVRLLVPVLTKTRCITLQAEATLVNKIDRIKKSIGAWIRSDESRK